MGLSCSVQAEKLGCPRSRDADGWQHRSQGLPSFPALFEAHPWDERWAGYCRKVNAIGKGLLAATAGALFWPPMG